MVAHEILETPNSKDLFWTWTLDLDFGLGLDNNSGSGDSPESSGDTEEADRGSGQYGEQICSKINFELN